MTDQEENPLDASALDDYTKGIEQIDMRYVLALLERLPFNKAIEAIKAKAEGKE